MRVQANETESATDATLRLVIEKHKRFYLNTIQIASSDSAVVVMGRIRAKREDFFGQISLFKPIYHLFWRHSIDIVTIYTVVTPLT